MISLHVFGGGIKDAETGYTARLRFRFYPDA